MQSFATLGLLACFRYFVAPFPATSRRQRRCRPASQLMAVPTLSLADAYHVQCRTTIDGAQLELIHLNDMVIDKEVFPSQGARSWASLHDPQAGAPAVTLTSTLAPDTITVSCNVNNDLVAVLSRVLVQWTVMKHNVASASAVTFSFPDGTALTLSRDDLKYLSISSCDWIDDTGNNVVRILFGELDESESEIIEMVDHLARPLGCVPRQLVHQFNLLHRGIGMFVTRDRPMNKKNPPDLYCHQRTPTKRIFPSLYDMFVGGVSLVREDSTLTARREVAEELGLSGAVEGMENKSPCPNLSEKLLTCVVCTGYNRCVVDLFSYVMDTKTETVSWQEEEVSWGAFVPYSIVEASADLSIMRLASRNEWPGKYPPLKSTRKGPAPKTSDPPVQLEGKLSNWDTFDYVPDGLLVWEAWLENMHK